MPEFTEAELEADRQKHATAPRLTPELIDEAIVDEAYHRFLGTNLIVCALTLKNGFHVVGESAPASPENFDESIGRKNAHKRARDQIWKLEGYLLREQLASHREPEHPTQ